jgi:hypothetical protein
MPPAAERDVFANDQHIFYDALWLGAVFVALITCQNSRVDKRNEVNYYAF